MQGKTFTGPRGVVLRHFISEVRMADHDADTKEQSPQAGPGPATPDIFSGNSAEFRAIYDMIKLIASSRMKGERAGHSLSPTDLIHEVMLRLLRGSPPGQKIDRAEFISRAVMTMRCVLVDHARRRKTGKHVGGREREPLLDEYVEDLEAHGIDLLILDEALARFARLHPIHAEMIQMRFLAGMTSQEIADCFAITPKTVENKLSFAKAFLHKELKGSMRE
jgi:RNA polymerase sigma factor (TIGR02999 family)